MEVADGYCLALVGLSIRVCLSSAARCCLRGAADAVHLFEKRASGYVALMTTLRQQVLAVTMSSSVCDTSVRGRECVVMQVFCGVMQVFFGVSMWSR